MCFLFIIHSQTKQNKKNHAQFLSIASMVMRILNLVCLIILLAHWNGCLQFLVPMLQSFPKDSWVCLNNLQVSFSDFTIAEYLGCVVCINKLITECRLDRTVYGGFVQGSISYVVYRIWYVFFWVNIWRFWMRIGIYFCFDNKGRYPPQTYTDMWLTMLSMVTGAMCYAVTIGHVSALVQSFDTSRRMYNEKVSLLIMNTWIFGVCC